MSKYSPYILYLAIALLVVVLAVNDFGPLNSLQRSLDDFLCDFTADKGIRPNVVLVDIDGPSLDKYGRWPWDHDLIADLTAATAAGEPRSILLDVDLYENSDQASAGHTNVLAEQLGWIKQTVLPYDIALSNFRSSKTRNPDYLFNSSVQIDNPIGIMDESSSLLARKVFLPAENLLTDKPLLGFDYLRPDEDRCLRHQPLLVNYDGYYYPSSSLLAAATFLGVSPGDITVTEGHSIQLGSGTIIPITAGCEFPIKFSSGTPFVRYSAAQILDEEFNREVLKNKAVIIGQLNGIESEYFDTPVAEAVPEMLVKATAIENIINGNVLVVRSDLAKVILVVILALGGVCAFVLPRVSMMYRMVILGGGLILLANANYMLFASYSLMVPSVYLIMELLLFMLASPLLESELLTGESDEEPAQKKAMEELRRARQASEAEVKEVPLREIRASEADPENTKTAALSSGQIMAGNSQAADKPDRVSDIDHQTISLDDSDAGETMISDAPADDSEDAAQPEPVEEEDSTMLSDSDAQLVADARQQAEMAQAQEDQAVDSTEIPVNPTNLQNLGRYQIQGVLGKGAMGTVYRGVDPAINRPVALKTIRLDFVSDPDEMAELKERLHREAQAAGKLSHPNIVTIYDVGSEGSLQYIAMEYLEGCTLEEMIKKKTRFNYRIIAQMISQVCMALEYAHQKGIVHRDIKPANIMVLGDYRIKVMDFGIARVDSNSMTKTGIAMGTPNYISPEQLKGSEIDRRADIFSLGVMMYEMLLGKRPFKGENLTSLMYAVLNHEPEKPSAVRPQVPLLFDHIIGRALKKDPADRYQKASEIMTDLQDFVESFSH